jgi:adenylate kinase
LNQRTDDKLETVLERLRVYHEQTEDLIRYYKENGILKEITSDLDVGMVTESILENIDSSLRKKSSSDVG